MIESGKVLPYLYGLYFPAKKEEIIEFAQENNAPEDVILILRGLDKTMFMSITELIRDLEIEGFQQRAYIEEKCEKGNIEMILKNRQEAGILLADKLIDYRGFDSVVYALPRGGVVVGTEIAERLGAPLDVAIAKKIGHPFNPEYAICAVTEEGEAVCNEEAKQNIDEGWLKNAIEKGKNEAILRIERYSKIREPLSPRGKVAILVDDGIATGLTMKAAIKWVKNQKPKKVIVAVPVIPKETAEELAKEVDDVVALEIPELFLGAVGAYYIDFGQVNNEEVERILSKKYDKV